MSFKGSALAVAGLLFLTGCTEVTVQVPPEVDLQGAGITTVAIVAADLPGDPAPVGTLLRAETSAQIRRLLPALVIVEEPEAADAVLQMEVANHGVGPAYFQTSANVQTGRVGCDAWQEAFLMVNASVFGRGKPSPTWEALMEKRSRIALSCVPKLGPLGTVETPAVSDPQLVSAIVRELGMRLAGYTRREFRPAQAPKQP